jgi:hypothetical protein
MTQSSVLFTSSSVYRAPIFEVAPYFHNVIYILELLPVIFLLYLRLSLSFVIRPQEH